MGLLTFSINLTLDGCVDHRVGVTDDALHDYWTEIVKASDAVLWGRVSYELMEAAWPQVAGDPDAPRALREWALEIDAKPKYVASTSRREFAWKNTHLLEGDVAEAVRQLKAKTPGRILLGGPALALSLERWGLIDDYRFVIHPVLAGHGPTLFQGLERPAHLELVSTERTKSGVQMQHRTLLKH